MRSNLGWKFNKEYFQYLSFDIEGKNTTMSSNTAMDELLEVQIDKIPTPDVIEPSFKLQTVYPGLLIGSGYRHEIGGMDEEYQLGFYFDHTTGLPVIPASSIKGVLRYACEVNDGKYLKELVETHCGISDFDTKAFVDTVFEGTQEGKGISIYQRDIFLDAFPIHSVGKLLGSDYITPHDKPLKDPVPIKFLRVQSQVTYAFSFMLKDSNGLTAEQKKKVFKQIIKDFGLGAKTNVGYGQFVELSKKQKDAQYTRSYEPYEPSDNPKEYAENDIVEMKIIAINETAMAFRDDTGSIFSKRVDAINKKFEKDLKRKRKKKPNLEFTELAEGMTVEIRFNKQTGDYPSFTVLPIIKEE